MKKILSIIMVCFLMLGTGCSTDNNGLVRTMKNGETKENINGIIKGTKTIVEEESGNFDDLCKTIEESIPKYDDLFKKAESYISISESNGTVKKEELKAVMDRIQSDQDACENKRKGIYTYNENFNTYWTHLTDSYNCLKVVMKNVSDLDGNGSLKQAKDYIEKCKKSFKIVSDGRGKIKENILKEEPVAENTMNDEKKDNGQINEKQQADKSSADKSSNNYVKALKEKFSENIVEAELNLQDKPYCAKISLYYLEDQRTTREKMGQIYTFSKGFFKTKNVEYVYFSAVDKNGNSKGTETLKISNDNMEVLDSTIQ